MLPNELRKSMPLAYISRRGFLVTLAGSLAIPSEAFAVGAPASGQLRRGDLETDDVATALSFTPEWSHARLSYFPRSWIVPTSMQHQAFTIELTWDSRLFDVDQRVLISTRSGSSSVELVDAELGSSRLAVPAGALTARFSVRPRNLFPNENLDAPTETRLTLLETLTPADLEYSSALQPATPWGAELAVAWTESSSGPLPEVIQMASIGPNPVPQDTTLLITLPTQTADRFAPKLAGPGRRGARRAAGSRRTEVLMSLSSPLDPGQTLRLEQVGASTSKDLSSPTQIPTVSIDPPRHARHNARATGRLESVPVSGLASRVS